MSFESQRLKDAKLIAPSIMPLLSFGRRPESLSKAGLDPRLRGDAVLGFRPLHFFLRLDRIRAEAGVTI